MLGSAPCSENIGSGPIIWLFLEKKKKLCVHSSLINRSMTKY
jgi:hypothetical protein